MKFHKRFVNLRHSKQMQHVLDIDLLRYFCSLLLFLQSLWALVRILDLEPSQFTWAPFHVSKAACGWLVAVVVELFPSGQGDGPCFSWWLLHSESGTEDLWSRARTCPERNLKSKCGLNLCCYRPLKPCNICNIAASIARPANSSSFFPQNRVTPLNFSSPPFVSRYLST